MSISIKLNESLNVEIDDLSFLYFSWNKHSSNEHKASHKSHEEYRPTGYCDWHHKPVCKKKKTECERGKGVEGFTGYVHSKRQ